MPTIGRVLFDESHRSAWSIRPEVAAAMNPQQPADAGYTEAAAAARLAGFEIEANAEGGLDAAKLAAADILVIPHCAGDEWESTTGIGSPALTDAEIAAVVDFVSAGGGLVLLAETEFPKYGNTHAELAAKFGIGLVNATVQDPVHNLREVATWVLGQAVPDPRHDLLAGVRAAAFYRAGGLAPLADAAGEVRTVMTSTAAAKPAELPLLMTATFGRGRVVVVADSDLFGDDSITDLDNRRLWLNLLTWVAGHGRSKSSNKAAHPLVQSEAWKSLVEAVEEIRPMQNADGSLNREVATSAAVEKAARQMAAAVTALAPEFPHQAEQLKMTVADIEKWIASDFAVPDFYDSLMLFHPDERRIDGIKHLAVFPMYTQNGNRNRNFEAVITNTFWPDFAAELEATVYHNKAFVPIEFVGTTAGYDTHSAVLFPETVATRETGVFTWGGIFCDREAARFRRIATTSVELLRLPLPPAAELLLADQELAQQTFVLWDLIHDRAHSHGDLPFDPFMIKQRMPYWMYALEELRCDLNSYRETLTLDEQGVYFGQFIRYAVLFDRLFRFPTTGERVRNYDGLGGQIIFAWLHRNGVLRWTDNTLSIDWLQVDASMVALCEAVEELYRTGIDRSRIAHWLAAHDFVSQWVEPHPGSVWAKGVAALPINGELREMVDVVLPDEFPLNVFYEALRTKLAPTIAEVAGITG